MPTHALISYDLKQNTESDARRNFEYALERLEWKDCKSVASTKTNQFSSDRLDTVMLVIMDITGAAITAKIKEIAYVVQCGNSPPVQKTFKNPNFQ